MNTGRSLAYATMMSCAAVPAAKARSGTDTFFGIAGTLVQQCIVQEQAKREQRLELQLAEEAERQFQEEAAQLQFNLGAQSALQKLGFYRLEIDGAAGPGTRAAIATHQPSSFRGRSTRRISGSSKAGRRAGGAAAPKSGQQGSAVSRNVEELLAAQEAGFENRDEWAHSTRHGIADFGPRRLGPRI